MFKNKKTVQLIEHWEHKLNIEYDTELEYYKKLCGLPYKYKMLIANPDLYDNSKYITYDKWEKHILKTIENCTINELEEYSRFLNQQYRNKGSKLVSFQALLIPYAICIISGGILSPIFSMVISDKDFGSFVIAIIFITIITILFKCFCHTHESEIFISNFYQDIKEIVDERIQTQTNTAEKQQ